MLRNSFLGLVDEPPLDSNSLVSAVRIRVVSGNFKYSLELLLPLLFEYSN